MKNFFSLYFKECRKVLCSLTFVLYTAAVFVMYFTQFHSDCSAPEAVPEPGMDDYGMISREVPEILMTRAVSSLVGEYLQNSYVAYPFGFYKEIHLLENKRQKMADIIRECTGLTRAELDSFEGYDEGGYVADGNGGAIYVEPTMPEYDIPETLTYERFRELMREADEMIGGGSRYSDEFIVGNFSNVPKTYEEALAEYNELVDEDKITGAYARLYCDYIGLMLAILPVFVAVSLTQLDRKARMEQLVYSRRISSVKLVFARYAALVSVMLLPVIVTAVIAQAKVLQLYPGCSVDMLAFARYAVIWLFSAIMITTAVGMFVTELGSGLLAIFIQGAWWFVAVFSTSLKGSIGKFDLVVRHNSLYHLDLFQEEYGDFVFNRVFFAVAALVLVALTTVIYEQKRRGISFGIPILGKNRRR